MTVNPCWNNGNDCKMRYVGCKSTCAKWQKWLVIHAEEKAAQLKAKSVDIDVRSFELDRGRRDKTAYHREYMRQYRKDGRE